jgi:Holliday junction resolvasome RuvABC DNA-binding subunit
VPIGPDNSPPAFNPSRYADPVSKVLFGIFGLLVGIVSGIRALGASMVQALTQQSYDLYPNIPLTPSEAAIATVKNSDPGADLPGEARLSGMSPERFALLVALTGNPPGPETLLEMWRRLPSFGEPDVRRGLLQGYLKDEWIDTYEQLRYSILSPADYVQADVQNAQPAQDWKAKAAAAGLSEDEYATLFWIAGNPPGPTETLTMLQRGIFSEAQAEQALRESRLKDKYISSFMQLVRRRIPFRTYNTLLTHGAITQADAIAGLQALGYTSDDANTLIKSAVSAKTALHKQLTESNISTLYEAHVITQAQAIADLVTLGYDSDVAQQVLQLADARAQRTLQQQAVNKVRTIFVAHRMTESQARADLTSLGVDPAQIDLLIKLWVLEHDANVKTLTEAQLRKMVGANVITAQDYITELVGQGYTTTDATNLAKAWGLTT